MKKYAIFLFSAMLICTGLFAQTADTDISSIVVSLIPVKYQATVLFVVTILYVASEILGSVKSIKSNSTIQLFANGIKSLFGAFKAKK